MALDLIGLGFFLVAIWFAYNAHTKALEMLNQAEDNLKKIKEEYEDLKIAKDISAMYTRDELVKLRKKANKNK